VMTGLVPVGGVTRRAGQARKLEREDDLGIEHRGRQSIDTLRVRPPGHCEHRETKTASGAGVHRAGKADEASPKEQKRTRGHEHRRGVTPPSALRIPAWSRPRGRRDALRRRRVKPAAGDGANGAEDGATDEVVTVRSGEETPEARSLDVAAG
jgi:hypothetical protein